MMFEFENKTGRRFSQSRILAISRTVGFR